MSTIAIAIPIETYRRLEDQARRVGTTPEALTRTLLEAALGTDRAPEAPAPCTARAVLQAAGRIRPLSDALAQKILPGVTLDEVRAALSRAGGPSLSALIDEQRGPRP